MSATIDQMAEAQANETASRIAKLLGWVPRALASKPHIVFLTGLGVYLVLMPLFQVHVSAFAELVGGNYTNVTSDLGACIAAGGTLHIIRSHRQHRSEIARLHDRVKRMEERLAELASDQRTKPSEPGGEGS